MSSFKIDHLTDKLIQYTISDSDENLKKIGYNHNNKVVGSNTVRINKYRHCITIDSWEQYTKAIIDFYKANVDQYTIEDNKKDKPLERMVLLVNKKTYNVRLIRKDTLFDDFDDKEYFKVVLYLPHFKDTVAEVDKLSNKNNIYNMKKENTKYVKTFESFFANKVNETGEWNSEIDYEFIKNNPEEASKDDQGAMMLAMQEEAQTLVDELNHLKIDAELKDIVGFDNYQGCYALVSIKGSEYKLWAVEYDYWIEGFPLDNTGKDGKNKSGFQYKNVYDAIEEINEFFNGKTSTDDTKVEESLTPAEEDAQSAEYYKNQLDKVLPIDQYGVKIVLHGTNDKSKFINLNKISKKVLIDWLNENIKD